MSVGFGFSLPALAQYGGGGNNPFGQLGPTLDLSFAGTVTDTNDPNGYTLNTNFIAPQYQVAADYTIWETNVGLVSKTFGDIITFTRASSATFTGSNGLIQSATTNTPRFDYDPVTLAVKGLLIEEQRTNLLTYSEDFSNAAWGKLSSSLTSNAAIAPDGTLTADKLIPASAATTGRIQQIFAGAAGTTYTLSVYGRAEVFSSLRLYLDDNGSNSASVIYNLSTGALTGGPLVYGTWTSASSTITSVGNGWYRATLTFTATSAAPVRVQYWCQNTGDGTSGIFLWGAQLEAEAFATSYIPTVASQVTRSADVASVNTLSPWYNQTEGTLVTNQTATGFSASNMIVALTDGGTANILQQFYNASTNLRYSVQSGGSLQAEINNAITFGQNHKTASAYKANDFALVVNAGSVGTDTSGVVPVSLSQMGIGNRNGALFFNGHIRRITYYPRRLSNAELVSITT